MRARRPRDRDPTRAPRSPAARTRAGDRDPTRTQPSPAANARPLDLGGPRARALLATALLFTACHHDDIVADLTTNATPDASTPTRDAGVTPDDYCAGSGPPLLVGDGTTRECGGQVAQRTFRYGLCVCEDFAASHTLTTDAFDSAQGPYTPGGAGGSVGTNGRFAANAAITIGGSLFVADPGGVQSGPAAIQIGRRLFDHGPVAADGDLTVGGDAVVGGALRARNLTVGGTLTLPDASAIDVAENTDAPTIVEAPVSVAPPCECDDGLVDIAAYVERHRAANDNAAIDLSTDALANVAAPTELRLPCGRYFLDRVGGQAPITIVPEGRAAIFVAGDLAPSNTFAVQLEPGAELDLFVGGNVVASTRLELGDADHAARVRLYIGGSGTIQLDDGAALGGNVYAPRADLSSAGAVEVFGALFVRRVATSDRLDIHYDRAVLAAGDDCPEPAPAECVTCTDCLNQACNAGICGGCSTDADCCSPLRCVSGRCEAEF